MKRVLFITTGLRSGGAEMMLWKLLSHLHQQHLMATVVSLRGREKLEGRIKELGVPVFSLGFKRPWQLLGAAWRLGRVLRTVRPHVIQGWMYHGNLAALLVAPFAPGRPLLFWSVRQSLQDLKREKSATAIVIKVGAKLSNRVDGVIYNSAVSRRQHEGIGFSGARSRVIDNGFDTALFQPDPTARAVVREELGLPSSSKLVGLIARYHPMKGHLDLLQAAARVVELVPEAYFVLAGWGVMAENQLLGSQVKSLGLERHVALLGEREDVPRLTAALDVAVSASKWGDAFPNSLGEAMSCGVPCIATEVGDARRILGESGVIVPPGDVASMVGAIVAMLTLDETKRSALGRVARSRVISKFPLEDVALRYLDVYQQRI